jgi:hypothetical protein
MSVDHPFWALDGLGLLLGGFDQHTITQQKILLLEAD